MENVTKALLIAAATLLAILLISLGVFVYNKAANQANQANLNGLQIQQFNEKFLRYNGKNIKDLARTFEISEVQVRNIIRTSNTYVN